MGCNKDGITPHTRQSGQTSNNLRERKNQVCNRTSGRVVRGLKVCRRKVEPHLDESKKEVIEEHPERDMHGHSGEHGDSEEVPQREGSEKAQVDALDHGLEEGGNDSEHVEAQPQPAHHPRNVDIDAGVGHVLLCGVRREHYLVATCIVRKELLSRPQL